MTWQKFNQGSNIGSRGSEDGIIVADEEHDLGARVTLERDCRRNPFAITLGIYGALVHTIYSDSEAAASSLRAEMKGDLERILELRQSADTDAVQAAIFDFVQRYP